MTRRTARITFLIEYEEDPDDVGPPDVAVDQFSDACQVYLRGGAPVVIGTPKLEVHDRPICSLSQRDVAEATGRMAMFGGTFTKAFSTALYAADSANTEKLTEEFWNFINSYLPKEAP